MARCIFSYTAPGNDHPEHIKLQVLDDGQIVLTVRGPRKPENDGIRFYALENTEAAELPREKAWELSAALRQALLLTED